MGIYTRTPSNALRSVMQIVSVIAPALLYLLSPCSRQTAFPRMRVGSRKNIFHFDPFESCVLFLDSVGLL